MNIRLDDKIQEIVAVSADIKNLIKWRQKVIKSGLL